MRLLYRFWQIFWGLVPPIAIMMRDYHVSLIMGGVFDWDTPRRRARAAKLTKALAGLGPTFIKLAQVLAARADLFPGIYLDELGRLHDSVPPIKSRKMVRQFRAATGVSVEDAFDAFDREPVASASLGQVHKALTGDRQLAVKILKPGIRKTVDRDLRLMAAVFSLTTVFVQSSRLDSLITIFEQFSRTIYEEMDLALEAEHMAYFRERYADDDRVAIPSVVAELSNRDVLVMGFIDGIRISDAEAVRAAGHDTDKLMNLLVRVFAEQILHDGVFHADPHPGNIFVDAQGRICLLDFGLVARIPRDVRKKYTDAIVAVIRRDYDTLIDIAFDLRAVNADVNPLVLRQAAQRLMAISLREDLGPIQTQKLVAQVMDVFYAFPLQIPAELVYVAKTMTLIEGFGASYRPGYNLMKDAQWVFQELLKQELEQMDKSVADLIVDEAKSAVGLYENMKFVAERAAREELVIRMYRGDLAEMQRIIGYTIRRLIAAVTIFGGGLTTAVIFLETDNWWILAGGGLLTSVAMLVLFLMPGTPKTPRIVLPPKSTEHRHRGDGPSTS